MHWLTTCQVSNTPVVCAHSVQIISYLIFFEIQNISDLIKIIEKNTKIYNIK
jgi:hypothetical protein